MSDSTALVVATAAAATAAAESSPSAMPVGAQHYAFIPWVCGPRRAASFMDKPRPLVTSMATGKALTQGDLLRRRLSEHLSTQALLLRIGLPIFVTWNQVQEQHIADTEKHGHIEVGPLDELRVAVVSIAPSLLYSYGVAIFETGVAWWLLREETSTPFRKSVVFESELPLRLWPHYVGNILESMWLPRRWSLLGVPPTQAEIDYFEAPVSFACAFEDSLKRHTLSALSNCVCATVAQLAMLAGPVRRIFAQRSLNISSKQMKRAAIDRMFGSRNAAAAASSSEPVQYVWNELPAPTVREVCTNIASKWLRAAAELFGGALCGATGTWLSGGKGGSAEYWMTMLPWLAFSSFAAYRALAAQYQKLKEEMRRLEALQRAQAGAKSRQAHAAQFQQPQQHARPHHQRGGAGGMLFGGGSAERRAPQDFARMQTA